MIILVIHVRECLSCIVPIPISIRVCGRVTLEMITCHSSDIPSIPHYLNSRPVP